MQLLVFIFFYTFLATYFFVVSFPVILGSFLCLGWIGCCCENHSKLTITYIASFTLTIFCGARKTLEDGLTEGISAPQLQGYHILWVGKIGLLYKQGSTCPKHVHVRSHHCCQLHNNKKFWFLNKSEPTLVSHIGHILVVENIQQARISCLPDQL